MRRSGKIARANGRLVDMDTDSKYAGTKDGARDGRRRRFAFDLRWISFGSPSAIVTSMALIVGLDAATASRATVLTSLLIIGIADNLSDSLSVHIYQESERLAQGHAFRTTLANFAARFAVSCSFFLIFFALPTATATYVCVVWGFLLLSALSYLLARARNVGAWSEILKHTAVAVAVILISNAVGVMISGLTILE
jgi:VIT1/CCC1 family predicted Fe2+/Mn2+ transporter